MTVMINRWKILPHRIPSGARAGQCRECGQHDASSAPDTCARCGLERRGDRGFHTVANVVAAFEEHGHELWRNVAASMRSGQLRAGWFYVFVGHGDGGPLDRPVEELLSSRRDIAHAATADRLATGLIQRYPQVWVVTTIGAWSITGGRHDSREDGHDAP